MHSQVLMCKNSPPVPHLQWKWKRVTKVGQFDLSYQEGLKSLFGCRWPDCTWLPCSLLTSLFMCNHNSNWLFDRLGPFMSIHPSSCEAALINTRDGGNGALESAESIKVISWGTVQPVHEFMFWCSIFSSVGHHIDPTGSGNWASYEIMWHKIATVCLEDEIIVIILGQYVWGVFSWK